jgi:hypothetical protein
MINPTFKRYWVTAALGAGGMGEVYLALGPKLERRVALSCSLPGGTWCPVPIEKSIGAL